MLQKEQAERLTELTGLTIDQISEAHTSEKEVEITLNTGKLYSEDDISGITERAGTASAKKGANTIVEMKIKEIAKAQGIWDESDTFKTIDELIGGTTKKALTDAKIEPNTKIKGLETDLETLRGNNKIALDDKDEVILGLNGTIKQNGINNYIGSLIPNQLPDGWTKSDLILLFRNNHNVDYVENTHVLLDNSGEVIKDDKVLPVKIEVKMFDFLKSKNINIKDGVGGETQTGADVKDISKIETMEQFKIYVTKQGWHLSDTEAIAALKEVQKNGIFKY